MYVGIFKPPESETAEKVLHAYVVVARALSLDRPENFSATIGFSRFFRPLRRLTQIQRGVVFCSEIWTLCAVAHTLFHS